MFERLIVHARNAINRGDIGTSMAVEKVLRYCTHMIPKPIEFVGNESSILAAHEEICRGIDNLIAPVEEKSKAL